MSETEPSAVTKARAELVAVSRLGYERGLVPGVSGNNSVRVSDRDEVVIKASGGCMGTMTSADTVRMDLDGTVLDRTERKPSKEWRWHLEVYRIRPEVGGIAHLHPPQSVAFTVADTVMPLVHTAARGHIQRIATVGLLPAGSHELAAAVAEAFADPEVRAVLMREHGTITVGPDLWTAHYRTEYLEDNARVAAAAAALNNTPPQDLPLAHDPAPLAEVTG
jgi:L-fuculose-phosphate aldolase